MPKPTTIAALATSIGVFVPVVVLFTLNVLQIEPSSQLMWALMGIGGQAGASGIAQAIANRRIVAKNRDIGPASDAAIGSPKDDPK